MNFISIRKSWPFCKNYPNITLILEEMRVQLFFKTYLKTRWCFLKMELISTRQEVSISIIYAPGLQKIPEKSFRGLCIHHVLLFSV